MTQSVDVAVLSLFEQAQAQPETERDAWLARQPAAPAVRDGVRRLLDAERQVGDFLDTVVAAPGAFDPGPAFPNVGDRLGSYELLRPLAAGGMGVVYLGRRADDVYRQDVAIKLIRSIHLHGDPKARAALIARFETERAILAQLQHPNIARILDGGRTASGVPYLVMDHVDGVPLTDHCRQHRLDVRARLALLCKVCDGVQEAHRHLIVHRDIKPDNILVTAAGEPRLIDFGIARELADEPDAQSSGTTLYSAMTPAYASPEQVRHQPLTTSSDVYSLGIVLYQLIAGRRPYELAGLSAADVERAVCHAEPLPLRRSLREAELDTAERQRRIAQVGPDLERIVAKALHKAPERRYRSAEALADDLRRYLEGRPVLAHPDSAWYRASKFVRRHRLGVGLAALALCSVLVAAGVALHQAASARRAADDATRANAFLVDVLNLSDPYNTGGELTLGEAMQRAYELVDERFADRPELAADLRLTLAEGLLRRGRSQEAAAQLERAAVDNETLFGAGSWRSVQAMVSLAALRRDQGRYAEAEQLYRDALSRIESGDWRDDALHSRTLNDLGLLYLVLENHAAADRFLRRAVDVDAQAMPPAADAIRAQTLANLAQAARGLGDYERAETLYAKAQAIFEAEHPDGSPQIAVVLNNRANLARHRDRHEEALELQRRAVEMHRKSYSGDHVMLLVPTVNLARQYVDLDRADEAMPYAEAAEAMAQRLYPDTPHLYRVQAIAALADTQRALRRFDEADATLLRVEQMLPQAEISGRTVEYVDIVRSDLCEAAPTLRGCSAVR
ncbi:serine/threonine-protein kinase [Xanthomonadaceae bacterium JHOS43]|nr:serine/threonine-protein kinase [Xanthomonadaceae bacterium JHOS43]